MQFNMQHSIFFIFIFSYLVLKAASHCLDCFVRVFTFYAHSSLKLKCGLRFHMQKVVTFRDLLSRRLNFSLDHPVIDASTSFKHVCIEQKRKYIQKIYDLLL